MSNRANLDHSGATVVIPTLNRGGFLVDCLNDLLEQDYQPLEILVVDQSEEVPGEVTDLVESHRDVISYHQVSFRGLPEARNYGWQQARHEALVYVDDDIRCGPRLVSEHIRALKLPKVGMVAGGIDEPNAKSETGPPTGIFNPWTATPTAGFTPYTEHDVDHVKGCNFSVWRDVIERAGGVDESLNIGAALYEELEMALRVRKLGYRIYFNGHARLTHLVAPSGGCRVDQVGDYVHAMAHNRSMVIGRHSHGPQKATALGRLMLLGASYSRKYHKPSALLSLGLGCIKGFRQSVQAPSCSRHPVGTLL